MGYEYATARLHGLRAGFVPEAELDSIAAGRDLASVILLLGDSVFAEEADRLKTRGREITPQSVIRAIEDGRLSTIRRAGDVIKKHNADSFAFIFSRGELEQIKDAMRCVRLGEPVHEKRFRFLPLSDAPQWTDVWFTFRTLPLFRQFLTKSGHPFAGIIDDEAVSQQMAELKLERHFFGAWLERNKTLAHESYGYFADLNDMVNLRTCALMLGHFPSSGDPQVYYVKGPANLRLSEFEQMTFMQDTEFRNYVSRRTGMPIKPLEGAAGFSLALHQAFLRKWRLAAIRQPTGILEILVFLEELNAMAMNLKLAVAAGAGKKRRPAETAAWFVLRKLG